MTECRRCRCGRMVEPEKSIYSKGKWRVMCHECVLRTRDFPTPEEAIDAWNGRRFTRSTLIIQKELRGPQDLDNDGCINLVHGIYSRAIQDYEIALEHPEEPVEYEDKKYIRWKDEIETLYRYGFYTDTRLGEAGIELLHQIIERRAEERRKREEAAERSRENQAS